MVQPDIIQELQKTHPKIIFDIFRQIGMGQIQAVGQFLQGDRLPVIQHEEAQDLIHPFIPDPPQGFIFAHPLFHDEVRCDQIDKLIINAVFQGDPLTLRGLVIVEYLPDEITHFFIALRLLLRGVAPEKLLLSPEHLCQQLVVYKQAAKQDLIVFTAIRAQQEIRHGTVSMAHIRIDQHELVGSQTISLVLVLNLH